MSSTRQNINNTYFEGLYKEVWKNIIPNGLTEAECDFIEEAGNLQKGNSVLDIMCGYGRHSLELAKRGYSVTAVDNLSDYTEEISRNAAEAGLNNVQAVASDVLGIQLNEQYNCVICMGNSFSFFERNDAGLLLKKVASYLKKGGIFIINSWMIAEIAIRTFREKDWHYSGEYKCILENRFFFNPSRIETEQTIIAPDGRTEVIQGIDYIFSLNELEEMMLESGLKIRHLYSTPRLRKFVLGDTRIYLVVEKL
ncbi:MAG: class I SAM-dependent methyltransferase [Flavisolibacter sp.]